jgi:hypothetical protein
MVCGGGCQARRIKAAHKGGGTFIAQLRIGRARRRFLYLIRAGGATLVLKGYAAHVESAALLRNRQQRFVVLI